MLQNRQSHRHSLCSVMSHVVLFAYPIKLNIGSFQIEKKIVEKNFFFRIEKKRSLEAFKCISQSVAMPIFVSDFRF